MEEQLYQTPPVIRFLIALIVITSFFFMSKDVICVKIEQLSLSFFLVAMMTYLCLVRTKQMLQKEHLPDYCIWIICVCVCVLCVCECDNC